MTLVETVKRWRRKWGSGGEAQIRKELDELREEPLDSQEIDSIKSKLQRERAKAGITEISSPGIMVTLDDNIPMAESAKSSDPASYSPSDYIIHDKDLLYLINELKAAGAKAISVNGQRIAATTDIRCVGTVVMINSTRVAPPFNVLALGEPLKLKNSLEQGREYPYLKEKKFPVKIEILKEAAVPAYGGSFNAKNLSAVNKTDLDGDNLEQQ